MAGELDPARGQPHSARMSAAFDTLAAADALRAAGMEPGQARAVAIQMRAAAGAGDAVTRPVLEAALAKLKTELLERIAQGERALREQMVAGDQSLMDRIAQGERALREQMVAGDQSLMDRIAQGERALREQMVAGDQSLVDRIAESERAVMDRIAALLWRLFGGIVAVAGLAVAVARLLPAGSVAG